MVLVIALTVLRAVTVDLTESPYGLRDVTVLSRPGAYGYGDGVAVMPIFGRPSRKTVLRLPEYKWSTAPSLGRDGQGVTDCTVNTRLALLRSRRTSVKFGKSILDQRCTIVGSPRIQVRSAARHVAGHLGHTTCTQRSEKHDGTAYTAVLQASD